MTEILRKKKKNRGAAITCAPVTGARGGKGIQLNSSRRGLPKKQKGPLEKLKLLINADCITPPPKRKENEPNNYLRGVLQTIALTEGGETVEKKIKQGGN